MNPFFSIIIPSHNGESCIGKCLDSVCTQMFGRSEVIVVCDHCTDKTVEIVRKYPVTYTEVDYQRDGLTRNAGIEMAKGDWILFLDHDDWWLHEYVTQMLQEQIILKPDLDVIYFSFIWRNVGYKRQTQDRHFPAVWNKAWKREFIGDTRFTDTLHVSDAEFDTVMSQKPANRMYWDMPFYYYNYLYPGSINDQIVKGVK